MTFVFNHASPKPEKTISTPFAGKTDSSARRRARVPGTDRTVIISDDMVAQFEQVFYGQYDRVVDGLEPLATNQFGQFEPAVYFQLEGLEKERAFNVIGNAQIGQQFDRDVTTGLRPSMVIQASTTFRRIADLIVTLACQVYVLSRGTSAYDWDLRAVVERQSNAPVYLENGMPGKGWVCVRRARQEILEYAVGRQHAPGSMEGMEPWVALEPFPFPTLSAFAPASSRQTEREKTPSAPRGEMVRRLSALGVGELIVGPFTSRVAVYSVIKRAKAQTGDAAPKSFSIREVNREEGVYEVTRTG